MEIYKILKELTIGDIGTKISVDSGLLIIEIRLIAIFVICVCVLWGPVEDLFYLIKYSIIPKIKKYLKRGYTEK